MNFLENIPFIIFSIIILIYSIVKLIPLKTYKKVSAKCLNNDSDYFISNDSVSKGYRNTYSYFFGNKEYVARESNYLGRNNKNGKNENIYVNPKDPEKILTTSQIKYYICFLIIAIVILLISLINVFLK